MRFCVIAIALLACPTRAEEPAGQRILFVGNSLTTANNLPDTVCRLAAIAGHKAVCESIARGGYSLDDHLADGVLMRRLREGRWSLVVLQQGPSALEESRVALRASVRRLAPAIRKAGARPALYAPWPSKARRADFPRVAESYELAARDVDAVLFSVGSAWQRAWRDDMTVPLYGSDDFHPSLAGSYLSALVIYARVFGELPPDFADPDVADRAAGVRMDMNRERLTVLLNAASGR